MTEQVAQDCCTITATMPPLPSRLQDKTISFRFAPSISGGRIVSQALYRRSSRTRQNDIVSLRAEHLRWKACLAGALPPQLKHKTKRYRFASRRAFTVEGPSRRRFTAAAEAQDKTISFRFAPSIYGGRTVSQELYRRS